MAETAAGLVKCGAGSPKSRPTVRATMVGTPDNSANDRPDRSLSTPLRDLTRCAEFRPALDGDVGPEMRVAADDEQRAVISPQTGFDGFNGIEIEVVCRLVEDQPSGRACPPRARRRARRAAPARRSACPSPNATRGESAGAYRMESGRNITICGNMIMSPRKTNSRTMKGMTPAMTSEIGRFAMPVTT